MTELPKPQKLTLHALKARARALQKARKAASKCFEYSHCLHEVSKQAGFTCYNAALNALKNPDAPQTRKRAKPVKPVLPHATRAAKDFMDWLHSQPHMPIIHFSGHGSFKNEVSLQIREPTTVSDLASLMSKMNAAYGGKLVLLNACVG
ncbi:hypothetical protein FV242_16565 [Methylobacterium sp. WL64]|uniref:hypothetical protein n=1 Tax=Methylobacterium sp. WL64 TaxID=2603894 RepID=UPI0011CA52A9|nr:hypothetical protein [Methylobacterium sp. WL64]TXN01986.1 hypothetical protein FV242_16565 [Methylobacterium sp. WL64]